jgi:uncharacterized protein (DUF1800 family)
MAMGFAEARHLLSRFHYGAPTQAEVQAFAPLTRAAAVDRLLKGARDRALTPAPAWTREAPPEPLERAAMEPKQQRRERRDRALDLKAWWYQELLQTPSPLTEQMTLFWHNHFTSSVRKVKVPALLFAQNALLRRHALGSFAALLRQIARDPAMVLYLDNQSNDQRQPNENFARELLELFTLGEGHYTEQDIKEAARAFTGWRVRRSTGAFDLAEHRHDDGPKVFLGRKGRFGGDDILQILLEQPRTAALIAHKLWVHFVSPDPDPREVERVAQRLRRANYQIAEALRALLEGDAFWAPERRGALIKAPAELLVGTARALGLQIDDAEILARAGRRLGQDLFDPPNVKGWPGGESWITTHTLLLRHEALRRAARGVHPAVAGLDADALAALLLPLPPVEPPPAQAAPTAQVQALLLDPVFQLK